MTLIVNDTAELLDPQLSYYTNGELQTFKQCRRKWWLSSYRQLGSKRQKVSGALAMGTKAHVALAEYYGHGKDPLEVLLELAERDQARLEEQDPKGYDVVQRKELEKDTALVRIIIEGYLEWLEETAADVGITIIAPEQPIIANPRIPGLEHVRLLGKEDVQAQRERDGARLFIDHKTCQTFESVKKIAHINEQFLHYHLLELLKLVESGLDAEQRTDGALINMLRKVKRTATAKPPFYDRIEVKHNLKTLSSYWRRVSETIRQIESLRDRLDAGEDPTMVAYPSPTSECVWKCEFFSICNMFDDGSRVEDYVKEQMVEINPLKRYEPESIGVVN